ncbi:hypothetical protein D3C85_1344250 [compost metagenome]
MWPTWWWPQALMQPLMLMRTGPSFSSRAASASWRDRAWATGMERALARLQ